MRQLLGAMHHVTDDERYRWLNDRVCAVEGEVRPRAGGEGLDVVLDVSLMTWEPVRREPGPDLARSSGTAANTARASGPSQRK
jgi:hypothetical protein